jgi:hypothetical protein
VNVVFYDPTNPNADSDGIVLSNENKVNKKYIEDTPEAKKKYYVKTTVKTGNIGNIYSSDSEGYTHVGFDEDEYNPTEDKSSIYKSLYS